MNRTRIAAVVALTSVFAGGCATVTEAGYYWGDYSKSLYKYTKTPTEQTLAEHTAELERIIAESNKRQLRVPPGIYAELGYIHSRAGNSALARSNYDSEMRLYPESRTFLERLTEPKATR